MLTGVVDAASAMVGMNDECLWVINIRRVSVVSLILDITSNYYSLFIRIRISSQPINISHYFDHAALLSPFTSAWFES